MIDIIYDMETQDPDDLFALAICASHPSINLRAVCVTPGSPRQIGLIKHALKQLDKPDVEVGSFNFSHPKECISPWWEKFLGHTFFTAEECPEGWEVCDRVLHDFPDATLVTGAPLKNLGAFLQAYDIFNLTQWVAQGGFAGDSVVPEEYRLEKFNGMETCPTFNFNGDPKSALLALQSENIHERRLISKNVCHGLVYDHTMHDRMKEHKDKSIGLDFIYRGMENSLSKHSDGKKFHDPLAVCAAINPEIIEYREVEVYRAKGKWGSRLQKGTNTWISIKADHDLFFDTMVAAGENE